MADDVFSPFPGHESGSAPGSAELLFLKRALFVLKGQFFDPIAQADVPLPPHRFAIAHSEAVFAEGTTSNGDGISTIFEPDTSSVAADAQWELFLIPIFDGRPDSDSYAVHGEAWIDVESKRWIPADELVEPLQRLETRKLLRIPLWSSTRKAARGGFSASPPAGASFATTGLLRTNELVPHGSPAKPWVVQIDHQWLRTWVALHCYDPVAKADRCVPQGVVLTSRVDLRDRVGGSSVMLPSGSIYMLHGGRAEDLPKMRYEFATPETSLFAYRDGKTVVKPELDTAELEHHYALPPLWGSPGHECWIGPGEPNAAKRKPFAELRTSGTSADKPLCFHLDDIVVTANGLRPLGVAGDGSWTLTAKRMCVLDGLLAIRQPAKDGDAVMPYSTIPFERQPLRAEEACFVRGEGFERMTRVIEYGGRIFPVDHHRMPGLPAFAPLVGARVARLDSGSAKSRCEFHILDTRWIRTTHEGVAARLTHVLAYVPAFVTAVDGDADDDNKNSAKEFGVKRCERAMATASAVWSQGHPGNPVPASPHKDYVIVPQAKLTAEHTVVRVRYHFGVREQENRVEGSGGVTDNKLRIQVHPQAGRATGGDPMHLYMVHGPDILAPPVKKNPEPKAVLAFEPSVGGHDDRYDKVHGKLFTLAHELGHSVELPDEYIEKLKAPEGASGEVGAFSGRARPFNLDFVAMMQGNRVPRLRYLWPFVQELEAVADRRAFAWVKAQSPLRAEYVMGQHTLRYSLPKGAGKFGDAPTPWSARSEKLGSCELFLFLAGDDEDSRGMVITPPGAPIIDQPFDGIMVITSKFWFSFDGTIADAKDRWEVMYDDFAASYYDRETCPKFMITSSGPWLTRVLLLVQPRCEIESSPTKLDDGKLETIGNADIVVRVRKGDRSRNAAATPQVLTVRKGDVGHFLLRYSLNPTPAVFDARAGGKLTAADFAPINLWFANTFGRTSKVVPL